MMKKGFTLLEIVVVIGVLSIVGVIILTIFTRTLKGNNKAQILVAIKQNGQSVLENMSQTIRNADILACMVNSTNSSTIAVVKNGIYTRYRISFPSDSACRPNGCILSDNPFVSPTLCEAADPMTSAQILTDTNPQTGVSVKNGSFTTNKSAGFKDSVMINFVLGPGIQAPKAISGQIDDVSFETTVQLR